MNKEKDQYNALGKVVTIYKLSSRNYNRYDVYNDYMYIHGWIG